MKSFLHCDTVKGEEQKSVFHLLTLKAPASTENEAEYKVSSYKFVTEAEERKELVESEIVLKVTPDLGLDRFELRDFKLAKEKCQFRLLFRNKTDYKETEKNNFMLLIFSSVTGDLEGLLEFNPGKEKITETEGDRVKKPENMATLHDAWIGFSEDLTIIDVRRASSSSDDPIFNLFSVSSGDQPSQFFTDLKNLENVKE